MNPLTLAAFAARLTPLYAPPLRSPRTAAKMARVLAMAGSLGVESTDGLTTEAMARYVAGRSALVSPNTVRGELDYLRAAANYAVEEGYLDRAPKFRRVRPRPAPATRPRVHPVEDVGKVLALLRSRAGSWEGHRLYALAATVAYTGLRRDEALLLMVEDVNLATGLVAVVARRRLKTEASAAPVPIPPELSAILGEWLPLAGSPWLFPGIRKKCAPWTGGELGRRPCDRLRMAGEECGVEGLTFLSLRHTFATHARRRWGLSALELRDCLRHTSPSTQAYYVHPDRDGLVRSVRGVSYAEGGTNP